MSEVVEKPVVKPTTETIAVNKTVSIKRTGNHRIHDVILSDSKLSISGCLNGRDVLRGCSLLDEIRFLPSIIGLKADDAGFMNGTREFWANYEIIVPIEGVILNCDHIITRTEGKEDVITPVNIHDWLAYNFALKHPFVAKDKESSIGNNRAKAYISDSVVEMSKQIDVLKVKTDMRKAFITLTDGEGFKQDVLTAILYVMRNKGLFKDSIPKDKANLIILSEKISEKYPKEWLELAKDKNLLDKSLVQELIATGVIKAVGNAIYDDKQGDAAVAESFDDFITFINNPKNSQYKTRLQAELKAKK